MSMLKSIAIAGFKSFGAEAKVPLRPLNVLIGANGSGKSNFLDAFSVLQAYVRGGVEDHVERSGGADKILHFGTRYTKFADIKFDFSSREYYYLRLHPTVSDKIGTSLSFAPGFEKK